jgi:hypothetical protein
MKLGIWRRSPGLELHETTVRENAIDETVLPDLAEDHLRELGLPMGAQPTNTSRGCDISPNLPCEVALKPLVGYPIVLGDYRRSLLRKAAWRLPFLARRDHDGRGRNAWPHHVRTALRCNDPYRHRIHDEPFYRDARLRCIKVQVRLGVLMMFDRPNDALQIRRQRAALIVSAFVQLRRQRPTPPPPNFAAIFQPTYSCR